MDLVSDETLGFELLAGADRCPDWSDGDWRTWYAHMADLFRAHIPASVRVFVNVDAHQALEPAIIEGLLAIPGRGRLVVEWTEHIRPGLRAADFCEASACAFARLKQAGFALAIDDVGSGYDGIGRALRVQPTFAKLDMSLTHLARRADPRF
ncbi:MAG: EAL domain-containing protein, partial [Thiomonas sp.]